MREADVVVAMVIFPLFSVLLCLQYLDGLTNHFLPFFFFLPPVPVPALGSAGTPPILTCPLSSACGADADAPSPPADSSASSGSAAMCRPSLPKFPISLPTSAPLFVSYFNDVPDAGSYVFNVKVTVTSSTSCGCGGGGDDVRVVSAGLGALFAS